MFKALRDSIFLFISIVGLISMNQYVGRSFRNNFTREKTKNKYRYKYLDINITMIHIV